MKALRALLSLVVLGSIIAFSGCSSGKGNSEPLPDKQFGLISKDWTIQSASGGSVLLGATDSTSHWTNFVLSITGTKGNASSYGFSCTGRPSRSVWPLNGTWVFGTDPTTQILRSDGAAITYTVDATGKNLQLKFSFTGTGYTRVSNLTGDWTFNLIPK